MILSNNFSVGKKTLFDYKNFFKIKRCLKDTFIQNMAKFT